VSAARPRIAVFGAGWWSTQAHLPSLRTDERSELVALADPSPERLEAAARAYGIDRAYADHRELLERERPDGVIVAVPHALHHAVARDALEAGASVLVEKPMTLRAEDAADLVRLADARGLHLMVGYTWHFNPQARALRAALAEGRLGDLQMVAVMFASKVIELYRGHPERYRVLFDYPVTAPDGRTYADRTMAGGGQGQTQVTHAAGLLLWLTGLVPQQVFASMERFDLEVDLVDALSIRFGGGVLGTIASTGGVLTPGRERLELRAFGTEGGLVVDLVAGDAVLEDAEGRVERLPAPAPDEVYPLGAPARHLGALIRGEEECLAPGALGASVVALLDAAYRSAAGNAPVEVVPPPLAGAALTDGGASLT
jgi:predicted dehydrogenase